MTFDPSKPVQTRDGRPARILCTDIKHPNYSIAAAYTNQFGVEIISSYTTDGISSGHGSVDLINVPEKRTVWVNVYPSLGYPTKALADKCAATDRIACVPLTYTVGEGL
jgi:hypothetical protein